MQNTFYGLHTIHELKIFKWLDMKGEYKLNLLSESGSINHSGLNSILKWMIPKIPTPSSEMVKIIVEILNGIVTNKFE